MSMTHFMSTIAGSPTSTRWCKWIENDDAASPDDETIDADADGFYTQSNKILVDLTDALSSRLGRQMSMMSTYRVSSITVQLLNQDAGINDNESGLSVSGAIEWWSPTKHRIDAMQMARQLEIASESTVIDADSFLLSTDRDYSGIRFNWDADGQVNYPTGESFNALVGAEWDLHELFGIYNNTLPPNSASNALWGSGRTGYVSDMGFTCSYVNNTDVDGTAVSGHNPQSRPFQFNGNIDVLAGLLAIDFTHSSTDSPVNTVDDDYLVQVTIGVEGWSDI